MGSFLYRFLVLCRVLVSGFFCFYVFVRVWFYGGFVVSGLREFFVFFILVIVCFKVGGRGILF